MSKQTKLQDKVLLRGDNLSAPPLTAKDKLYDIYATLCNELEDVTNKIEKILEGKDYENWRV